MGFLGTLTPRGGRGRCPPAGLFPVSPGCIRCPAGTEPVLGLEYKWWNVLPPNMETTVLSGINFEYKGMAGTGGRRPLPVPTGSREPRRVVTSSLQAGRWLGTTSTRQQEPPTTTS